MPQPTSLISLQILSQITVSLANSNSLKQRLVCPDKDRRPVIDQVSISSTFYVQLLRSQVPKGPNDTADLTIFFAHSGSTCIKAVCRTLMKLSPGVNFINILRSTFLYASVLCGFSLVTVCLCDFLVKGFWCKSCS